MHKIHRGSWKITTPSDFDINEYIKTRRKVRDRRTTIISIPTPVEQKALDRNRKQCIPKLTKEIVEETRDILAKYAKTDIKILKKLNGGRISTILTCAILADSYGLTLPQICFYLEVLKLISPGIYEKYAARVPINKIYIEARKLLAELEEKARSRYAGIL